MNPLQRGFFYAGKSALHRLKPVNIQTLFGNLFAVNTSEANPVLVKAVKATTAVKAQLAETNSDIESTQADIREELKRQEEIRQAGATFKASVTDLKKARVNLAAAQAKAATAVDRTAALTEELENELFNWESSGDDYVPTETPGDTTPEPAPTPATTGVVAPEWDGQDLSQLTPEQLELLK